MRAKNGPPGSSMWHANSVNLGTAGENAAGLSASGAPVVLAGERNVVPTPAGITTPRHPMTTTRWCNPKAELRSSCFGLNSHRKEMTLCQDNDVVSRQAQS